MTYKEMNAAVMLLGAVAISAWVLVTVLTGPELTLVELAQLLCWAIGISIVFNIVAVIMFTIVVSVIQRAELKDERADERDHAVAARSMRNAYFVVSIAGLLALIVWALGYQANIGVVVLFAGLMLGGAVDAASRVIYYRLG